MPSLRISTNPEFDLHEARFDTAEADSFYAAWSAALTTLAEAIGVEVEVARGGAEVRGTCHEDDDGESFETALWQAAQDHVRRTATGVWNAHPADRSLVDSLRSFARRAGVLSAEGEARHEAWQERQSTF